MTQTKKNTAAAELVEDAADLTDVAPWERNTDPADTPEEMTVAPDPAQTALIVPDVMAPAEIEETAVTTGGIVFSNNASEIDLDDMLIPQLRLGNGLSQEVTAGEARPGQWLLLGNSPVDKCEVVILQMGKSRELRNSDDDRNVLCKSGDGEIGVGIPGGVCATCPMSQWGPKNPQTGKGTPPPCSPMYNFRAYSLTHKSLCVLSMKKTAMNAAKAINTVSVMRGYRNAAVILGASPQKGPKGTYFVPTVTARVLSDEEKEEISRNVPF